MHYWSWWLGGLAMAGVAIANWLLVRRMLAVSGRYTAIVDRLRFGAPPVPEEPMSAEEMAAAIRAMTAATFGEGALGSAPAASEEPLERPPAKAQSKKNQPKGNSTAQSFLTHPLMLLGAALGGALSMILDGHWELTLGLRSDALSQIVGGDGMRMTAALLVGGIFVGFGTRMAGGCTSGHGLCGFSRLQAGSIVATLAFFGAGVATSFLLGAL